MSSRVIRVSRPAMGSLFEIVAGGEDSDALEQIATAALNRVDWLEQRLSHFLPDSDLCLLNARAYAEPVLVPPYLMELLLRLRQWSERTDGAFDPTAGKLVRLWGFFRRGQIQGEEVIPPTAQELDAIVQSIGWRNVELDAEAQTVRFLTPAVELHLGAAGKGYIVQCATDFLRESGITRALLHSGQSSIVAVGAPPDSDGWPVRVPSPSGSEETDFVLPLRDVALSTSGGAEQYLLYEGQRYSHLFDPRTGYPLAETASVSVLSPDATDGDVLSTAFLVQGEAWARAFCLSSPAIQAFFAE